MSHKTREYPSTEASMKEIPCDFADLKIHSVQIVFFMDHDTVK